MAAASLENGSHVRHTATRHLGPRQPVPQPPPGRQYPLHGPQGPGPYPTDHPPVHHPRPYFYVQPIQPPPPLYHYQWPMPIPFNPYSGYPGLGFGMPSMVMPPFPPHPYTEVPGYVLPHAALHPTEYRQYQFPPAAMIYQNNCRSRMFYQTATPRETANSEVQTEPPAETKDRPSSNSLLAGSDSGRGTDCTTPSSPSLYAEKLSRPVGESNSPVPSKTGSQGLVRGLGAETHTPAGTKAINSCRKSTKVLGRTGNDGHLVHHHVWSVCSAEGMVPMCSSSDQEDEVVSERHVSSSTDVIIGGETSCKMERAPKCVQTHTHEETQENATVVQPESSELEAIPCVVNDLVTDSKENESVWSVESLVPYVPSVDWMIKNGLMEAEDGEQDSSEKGSDRHANQSQLSFHFSQVPKKLNESVWSVQSLAPYVPSKELLMENGSKEPQTVTEKKSEVNVTRGLAANQVIAVTERRRSQRFSLTLENVKEAEKMSDEDVIPDLQSFCYSQVPKKLNESVWSVQSLAAYVPSREWLIQNGILDPEQVTDKESDSNVSQGLTASQVLAITERRTQRLSLSSVDSIGSNAPSSSWLADLGNVYYYGKLPLCSQENGNIFSTPVNKLTPSARPTMNSEALPCSKAKRKLQHDIDMEPVEKKLDGSPTLLSGESTLIPPVEGSLKSTQVSPLPEVQCNPYHKDVDVTECTPQNSPEDPETHASECVAGDQETDCSCPDPFNQEPVKKTDPVVPSRQDCKQIADVRMPMDPSSNGDFKISGLCSKLQQRNCFGEETILDVVSFRKSPTGKTTEGNLTKMALDLKHQEQQHRITHQKRPTNSRRDGKGRPNCESCDNGYGLNYPKKRRQWQNRPLRTQAQANPSNNPFGQGNGEEPWNGYDRPGKTRGANGRNKRY